MDAVWLVVYYALFLLWLFVVGRLVVEIVRSFARDWRPAGATAAGLEVLFMVTDPPVKLLRRLIPAVRIGNISLDLSIMILLLVTFILMRVVDGLIESPFRVG
ncbi:YggT family protein [Actinomycetospora sp. NBRC 106375]|uniref:YggT family protein n=1 Tax=Actinomycetospora sp. NBRC 106375 TaxID=3032207 RepID=UPI0024A3FAF8|nr:YggT family protein [Actinomycetospora sp. NBRC 106375]GLZ47623.1 YggT family protein [Actinomycetospora sp. NBRC 106375]